MSSTKIHLVDSHAHLYLDAFEKDRDAVINRARAQGVQEIFMPAIDVSSVHQALALCEHPKPKPLRRLILKLFAS